MASFAEYMIDALSKVYQYDFDGKNLGEIDLPGIGTVRGFSGKKEDDVLYYRFTNYANPSVVYQYLPKDSGALYYIDFSPDAYVSSQVFYASKDGTKIPMIITHKKGLERNGKKPKFSMVTEGLILV